MTTPKIEARVSTASSYAATKVALHNPNEAVMTCARAHLKDSVWREPQNHSAFSEALDLVAASKVLPSYTLTAAREKGFSERAAAVVDENAARLHLGNAHDLEKQGKALPAGPARDSLMKAAAAEFKLSAYHDGAASSHRTKAAEGFEKAAAASPRGPDRDQLRTLAAEDRATAYAWLIHAADAKANAARLGG